MNYDATQSSKQKTETAACVNTVEDVPDNGRLLALCVIRLLSTMAVTRNVFRRFSPSSFPFTAKRLSNPF